MGALSSQVWASLGCSSCGQALLGDGAEARCSGCGLRYGPTKQGALDLRLQRPKSCHLSFELGSPLHVDAGLRVEPLQANTSPAVDFTGVTVPHHMTRELMSYFPKAQSPTSLMLDLGCGDAVHHDVCAHAGFEWVGMDYDEASQATVLGDAHALPFQDESFEFVLSVATVHLFRYPWVVMREVHRILKPGGRFLGTVAFLEPFHDGGFFHHTHLGAVNMLQYGGFTVERLAPSVAWNGLAAQASMALFPKMPNPLARSLVWPLEVLHKLWWRAGRWATGNPNADESVRIRNTTGAFAFVASKSV